MRPKYMKPPTMTLSVCGVSRGVRGYSGARLTVFEHVHNASQGERLVPLGISYILVQTCFDKLFSSCVSHFASSGKSEIVKYKKNDTTQVSVPSGNHDLIKKAEKKNNSCG